MQRRDRAEKSAGDRQTDRREIGRELTKAEEYPTMKKAMELLRDGLRINIAQEARQMGAQRSSALPTHTMEISANCPSSPEFDSARDPRGRPAEANKFSEGGADAGLDKATECLAV